MIALHLTEIKDFMNKYLAGDLFQDFLLSEATIINGITYSIDGRLSKDASSELWEQYPEGIISIKDIRPMLFQMVKGKQTPTYMKFVLSLSREQVLTIMRQIQTPTPAENIGNLCVNITFQNQQILCTTGVSYSTFCKDKLLEAEWDRVFTLYLKKHQIFYETLT